MPLPQTDVRESASRRPLIAGLSAAAILGGLALWNRSKAKRAEQDFPPRGKFIEVDDVRLHYVERGQGQTLVLIHGNGVSERDFDLSGLIDALAKDFHVLAFDRPGCGYSERPRTKAWTPAAQARLIIRAVRQLGVEKPIVLGHSFGALVAVAAGLNATAEVSALVLLSGYYFPTLRLDTLFALAAVPVIGDVIRWTVSPLIGRAALGAVCRKLFAPTAVPQRFARGFAAELSLRPSQIEATSADAALMIQGALTLSARYGELAMPVVIVAGVGDRIASTGRQSERLHRTIPNSHLRRVPAAGHMIHHIALQTVIEEIDWVAGNNAAFSSRTPGKGSPAV